MAQKKVRNPEEAVTLLRRQSKKCVLLAIHLSRDLVTRHLQRLDNEKTATSDILRQSIVRGTRALVIGRRGSRIEPTKEDDNFTQVLLRTGRIVGICVLDHILLENGSYYSFKENGRLFKRGRAYSCGISEPKKQRLVCG